MQAYASIHKHMQGYASICKHKTCRAIRGMEPRRLESGFLFFLNHTAIACLPEGIPTNLRSGCLILLFLTRGRKRKTVCFPSVFDISQRTRNHSRQDLRGPACPAWKHSKCTVFPRVFLVSTVIPSFTKASCSGNTFSG